MIICLLALKSKPYKDIHCLLFMVIASFVDNYMVIDEKCHLLLVDVFKYWSVIF